jgi:peptide/nickel transport system substrate-binding protein
MRNIRWQLILLVIGGALIVGVVINQVRRSGGGPTGPAVEVGQVDDWRYFEAVVGEPRFINPLLATTQPDRDLSALIFSGLTRLNPYGEPIPDLAERWEVSEDGLEYTFYLRRDVVWHDGAQFTARDVDFTMSLLRDPTFAGPGDLAAFWGTVETYVESDYTVRFVLTQPLAYFPEFLRIGILPEHLLQGTTGAGLPSREFNLTPVGTGPLKLESLTQEGRVAVAQLTPAANHYDPARQVSFSEMELRFYANNQTAFGALQRGEVSAVAGLSADQVETALAGDGMSVYSTLSPIYAAIIFNQQDAERLPFFQDDGIRRALTMGLDRYGMVESVLGSGAIVAESPVLPGNWAYNSAASMAAYDPEGAAALLDQEGWVIPDEGGTRAQEGVPVSFRLVVSDQPEFRQLGQMVVEQWAALGVEVQLDVMDAADMRSQRLLPRNFDAALVEFGQGGIADPDPYPFWHQSQIEDGQNFSGLDDRDVSEAIEMARREQNGVRRTELYREFQQLFGDRGAAVLLYYPVYSYAVDCRVDGVQLAMLTTPSDRFRTIGDWHLVSQAEERERCSS